MGLQDTLRLYRERAGYKNARDFAENILKMRYTTFMGYELRGTWPTEETLCQIADALHVSVDDLLEHKSDRYAEMFHTLEALGFSVRQRPDGMIEISRQNYDEEGNATLKGWVYKSKEELFETFINAQRAYRERTINIFAGMLEDSFYDDRQKGKSVFLKQGEIKKKPKDK